MLQNRANMVLLFLHYFFFWSCTDLFSFFTTNYTWVLETGMVLGKDTELPCLWQVGGLHGCWQPVQYTKHLSRQHWAELQVYGMWHGSWRFWGIRRSVADLLVRANYSEEVCFGYSVDFGLSSLGVGQRRAVKVSDWKL